jgi:MarR family 2-MHQ and catechol resistance regulon transcriptional repressor
VQQLQDASNQRTALQLQARQLHEILNGFARRYQFRNRDSICCHDLSVSQCYTLAALDTEAQLNMGALAGRVGLSLSAMTRAVDQLVARHLVRRWDDPANRRVCRVAATAAGRRLVGKIQQGMLRAEEEILGRVAPSTRTALIRLLADIVGAVDARRDAPGKESGNGTARQRRPDRTQGGSACRS